MNRVVIRGALAGTVLLACTATEPCACPPARTSLIIYGQVRTAAGLPAAGALVQFRLAPPSVAAPANPTSCVIDASTSDADPSQARADSTGRFRSVVYSIFSPGVRCLRVTAFPGPGTAPSDSAQVDGLFVPFRYPRPDSVGVILTLR